MNFENISKILRKKLIVIILAMCTLFAISVNATNSNGSILETNHWTYDSIQRMKTLGYMIGRGTQYGVDLDPSGMITGHEVYMTLWRVAATPKPVVVGKPIVELNNATKEQWFFESYEWAVYSGIAYVYLTIDNENCISNTVIKGGRIGSSVDTVVGPFVISDVNQACEFLTRTDVILTLYYYVTTYLGIDVTVEPDMSRFADWNIENIESQDDDTLTKVQFGNILPSFTDEMVPAWQWAVANGIIRGCSNGMLNMDEYDTETKTRKYVTRAEYSVILERFIEYLDTLKI